MSLEEAVIFAQHLSVDLLFVMDSSPAHTLAWVHHYRSTAFSDIQVFQVDFGSLGLARDFGLRKSRGNYILFADEDDLISYNSIAAFYELASLVGHRTIVVPRYLVGFGTTQLLAQYRGSDEISLLSIIKQHPYISRIFLHHSAREELSYSDVRLSEGYAYEDWHFNATAIAHGYAFASAADTILYYRHRRSSLLANMDSRSVRQIPPNKLFLPKTFLKVFRTAFERHETGQVIPVNGEDIRNEFLLSAACAVLTQAANRIEPAISWRTLVKAPIVPNSAADPRLGAAYYRACRQIGRRQFSDIVLLETDLPPILFRRAISIMEGLYALNPMCRCLVLIGGKDTFSAGDFYSELLSLSHATIVNLGNLCAGLPDDELDIATLRLVESVSNNPTIHLLPCAYAHRFFGTYRSVLKQTRSIYYREPDQCYYGASLKFIDGIGFDFLSEHVDSLDAIVVSSESLQKSDNQRLAFDDHKWQLLPNRVRQIKTNDSQYCKTLRVLWLEDGPVDRIVQRVQNVTQILAQRGSNIVPEIIDPEGASTAAKLAERAYPYLAVVSLTQSLSLSLEIMATGTPVLTTEIYPAAEFSVAKEMDCVLRSDTNAQDFARTIRNLGNDTERWRQLSIATRRYVENRHNAATFLKALRAIMNNQH